MNWFHCHRNGEVAHVRVFGEILDGAETLIRQIGDAPQVELWINSPGGSSLEALAVHEAIQGRAVSVEISGRCYSAAATLAMAGRKIRIHHDARMMLHRPINYVVGDSDALRCEAKHLDKITARIVGIVAARTRQPEDTVLCWYRSGVDTYFSPSEALAVGLVDEILTPEETLHGPDAETLLDATPAKPGFNDAERLLIDFLNALGTVATHDKARLGRELGAWFTYGVREHE